MRGDAIGQNYLNERGSKILHALDQPAKTHQLSLAAIALSWLMHRKSITAPIVSATTIEQMDEFVKAVELKLTQEQLKLLNDASAW